MSLRAGSDGHVTRKQGYLEEVFTQTSLNNHLRRSFQWFCIDTIAQNHHIILELLNCGIALAQSQNFFWSHI